MAQSILINASDMLAGMMPTLALTLVLTPILVACSFCVALAAGIIHYNMALHSTGDLRHARQCRRDTIWITGKICAAICLSGLALHAFLT